MKIILGRGCFGEVLHPNDSWCVAHAAALNPKEEIKTVEF